MGLREIQAIKAAAGLPKEKKRYTIPKKSAKKIAQEKVEITERKISGGGELQRWFEQRRKEMTGRCANCGAPSCRDNDEYYKFSICHILPKAYVKSIATNENNWIELCFWGTNSCHTQMDNQLLDMTEMNCWNEIIDKFQKMYPFINQKERRRIPDILLNYIHTDK